jgi:Holliday junction resolvasome RuvABC ATP-dependent DNA helicase subunit
MYKDASDLVGVEGPRNELVKWLTNQEGELGHERKVISIVGCGGLGKTTLAKQVYDKLGSNFDCRALVSISRSPDMKKILLSILSQLHTKDHPDATLLDE